MKSFAAAVLLLLPLLASAQSNSQSQSQSQSNQPSQSGSQSQQPSLTVLTTTIVSTGVTSLSPGGLSTFSRTSIVTTTQQVGGNSSASATSSAPTSTVKLPTADPSINGGGIGGFAPAPGATGANGAFGPNDGYIAAASALKRNAFWAGTGGLFLGGALLVL